MNKKIYFSGLVGEIMEWFDFTVYGFFALVIAAKFFPSENQFVSLISAFAAFAIGFLMRPLGSIVFGHIGDIYGRKIVLSTSIFLMAIPSLIIGIMPTYETIGILAPIILILMRMLQGASVGGEHTASVIYLSELSTKENRAFSAVVPFVGTALGVLLGSLVGFGIYSMFSKSSVEEWAWRLPFIFGVAVAIVGVIIRKNLPESYIVDKKNLQAPLMIVFKNHLKPFIQVFFLNLTFAVGFYTVYIYNPIWMQKFLHMSESHSLEINSIALIISIIAMLISSYLSNKVGRKPILIISTLGMSVTSVFLYEFMLSDNIYHVLLSQSTFALFIGMFMGVIGVVMVELFDKNIRMSAVSVAFNLSFAIFGGTAPMVATWLIHTSHDNLSISWYLSISSIISFFVVLTLKETYKKENI